MTKKYWAHDTSKAAVDYLNSYHNQWTLWSTAPFRQAWVRNFMAYYSPVVAPTEWDSSLIFTGVQGELVRMFTPQARVMVRQMVTLVTKQRLSIQCSAQSEGRDVVQETKLGNSILDQVIDAERVDSKTEQLVEGGLVTGAAFVKATWRTDKGKPYAADQSGNLIYQGENEISVHSVFDVFYDINIPDWDMLSWAEVRTMKNRWDMIAQHEELEDKILQIPSVKEISGPNSWFERTLDDDDMIYVYECFIKPSPSMPKGRMIVYAADDCVFFDDDNPYEGIPVEPFIPEKVLGCGLGYPQLTNLLACQEMLDNSYSAIATNQAQFAVQSVTIARGSNVNVQELNGMRFVSFTPQNVPGGGKPEPLQLTQSSPETFKFADVLKQNMREMSNINGALTGAPPPGVTSGTAIATLSANALEFTSLVTKCLHKCLEKTFSQVLKNYQIFAKLPRYVSVNGKNNQVSSQPFVGEDLKAINAVKITVGNALMQTIAGRLEIAQQLMQMPREMWPDFVAILEGEPLKSIYKGALSEEDLINGENDAMSNGTEVPALATDNHPVHIRDHAALLNDPAIRINGQKNQLVLNHMLEHLRLSTETDPMLMAMVRTGKMPEGAVMPPPGPPGGMPPMGMKPPGTTPQSGPMGGMPVPKKAEIAQDQVDRGARQ